MPLDGLNGANSPAASFTPGTSKRAIVGAGSGSSIVVVVVEAPGHWSSTAMLRGE